MSFHLQQKESVQAGVRRIAGEQVEKAIGEIEDTQLDCHETVHQVRKRCKKIRGLLRLVRPSLEDFARENRFFRDAARELSYVRDTQSMIEGLDKLAGHFGTGIHEGPIGSIRAELVRRRDEVSADKEGLEKKLVGFKGNMGAVQKRLSGWTLDRKEFQAIEGGLTKTYRRGRKAMKRAYRKPSSERFHEWRKRVKYHWYHMRLLEAVWPVALDGRIAALDELGDLLGDEHDLAVLEQTLDRGANEPPAVKDLKEIKDLIAARRQALQYQGRQIGGRLYAEKPYRFTARISHYWQIWRCEQP